MKKRDVDESRGRVILEGEEGGGGLMKLGEGNYGGSRRGMLMKL